MLSFQAGVLAVVFCGAAAQAQSFCDEVRALTADPAVAAAHWGVSVTTLDGTPLCGVNDAQLFRPASNAKLFTASAALALLGPARTFTTTITGPLKSNLPTLQGNLELHGAGDPYLSERAMPYLPPGRRTAAEVRVPNPLEAMADQVVAAGVQHVTGNIVGSDALWPFEPYPPDWGVDDLVWGYGAPVSALTVDDNKLALTVTPGATAGSAGAVTLDPVSGFFQVEEHVSTSAGKTTPNLALERAVGSRLVRVFGTVPADAPYEQDIAITDPAEYAAVRLKAMLEARGVTVDGHAMAQHQSATRAEGFSHQATTPLPKLPKTPVTQYPANAHECLDPCTILATHVSPTLADDVVLTLKISQNLHAELLLHQLAKTYGDDGSTAQGCRVVRQYLLNAGLGANDFFLTDGSGLSTHDLATPRALTHLLVFAAAQPWGAILKAALPVGGVDGSLSGRFAASGSALNGKLFAKTGTLGETRALSGYVTAASGATVVFSVMVDTHAPNSNADRSALDRIVEAIAAGN